MVILAILLVILAVVSVIRPLYGFMLYVAIRLCLPTSIRVMNFSFNTIAFLVMTIFILPELIKRVKNLRATSWNYMFCRNFLFFVSGLLALSLVAAVWGVVPLPYQLSKLSQMVYTELLPAILLVIIMKKKSNLKLFNTVIAVCALFSLLYAIFTFVAQTNPICEFFYTQEDDMFNAAANSRSGM